MMQTRRSTIVGMSKFFGWQLQIQVYSKSAVQKTLIMLSFVNF